MSNFELLKNIPIFTMVDDYNTHRVVIVMVVTIASCSLVLPGVSELLDFIDQILLDSGGSEPLASHRVSMLLPPPPNP